MNDPKRTPAPASASASAPSPPPPPSSSSSSSSSSLAAPSTFSSTSTNGHHVITLWPPPNPTPQREQQRRQHSSPPPERPGTVHEPRLQRPSPLPPILPLPHTPAPAVGRLLPPQPTPGSRRGPVSASDVFFRTRICKRFVIEGSCGYGDSCSFAHGREELRSAAGNWQDIVAAGAGRKLCKIFLRGEPCPYGERCTFLHVDPQGLQAAAAEGERAYDNGRSFGAWRHRKDDVGGVREINQNPGMWKKKCYSWEANGRCPYGDSCAYAHGHAELKKTAGKSELGHHEDVHMVTSRPPAHAEVPIGVETAAHTKKKGFLKWEGKKKLVRIYGDWIDDHDK